MGPAPRSVLVTPASNDWMFERAAAAGADLVCLDLEDATAREAKERSRGLVADALRHVGWGRSRRAVRVNAIGSPWGHRDVIELMDVAGDVLDVLVVPKAETAEDVRWVDRLLGLLELERNRSAPVELHVLVETASALEHARARVLGYAGKWAIHPAQVEPANLAFGATADEITLARAVVTSYRARDPALGAISLDGVLVDEANFRLALRILKANERRTGVIDRR